MIVRELIEELNRKEIVLSYSGGRLKYSGPEENITPEILNKLKTHKASLIKYLWPDELKQMMPINPVGSRIPIFIVHGDNGNYILSDHFGPDQPVYGFFHPGSEGEGILYRSVKEMAAAYLKMMISVCPSGPYFLIGYSFGGIIAYEIAVQLQKAGNKVPFLVIIDSTSPLARESNKRQKNLFETFKINYLRPLRRGLKHEIHYIIDKTYILRKKQIPVENRVRYLWYKYLTLTRKYAPERFDGELLLIRLAGNPSTYKYLGWETLVNKINLVEIHGAHLEVFIGKDRIDVLTTEIEKYLNYIMNLMNNKYA